MIAFSVTQKWAMGPWEDKEESDHFIVKVKEAIMLYDANHLAFQERKSREDGKKTRGCPRLYFCCCGKTWRRGDRVYLSSRPQVQSIIAGQATAAGAGGSWSETSRMTSRENEGC